MKLVEIKECLENQVWYDEKNEDLYCIDVELRTKKEREQSFSFKKDLGHKLVGFVGINYNLNEQGELLEISREEFEDGDIVDIIEEYGYDQQHFELVGKAIVLNDKELLTFQPSYTIQEKYEELIYNKIGIYGVTHEFINNKIEE